MNTLFRTKGIYPTLVLLILLMFGSFTINSQGSKVWLITGDSRLELTVGSNVKDFHCQSMDYHGTDTLVQVWEISSGRTIFNGKVTLKASSFDCHNRFMTRDFHNTIKAGEFPTVIIQFEQLVKQPDFDLINGEVIVSLAGKSEKYNVRCKITDYTNDGMHIEGSRSFSLSDFDLEPPQKLFGAIKINDLVLVDFHLVMRYL
ncbi:hypothetical protein FHS59_000995 [Algoriphagus iocasae]|jgi:YceI-like domain.|uniref:Lipid/polyisoprenoid-binding YceI-like domain-containing protein n=1 Tax=Algoriphagus iocasae TaxID=1836499 RepID=A0A841MDI1_9BACT|nr:YceI family protein [Algoriphagus iocasae]MBB6325380.1 hypothetical protein [Algoriphagus iocasae]